VNLLTLFRRLVYAQVLLGIAAFCMAERNPGLLLIAGSLGVLSWTVVEGPNGRPLPHWVILLGAVGSVAWLLFDLVRQGHDVIIAMGHFTMWLQVLLLYGKKSNREYGEILVLSLLQMIGASVLSVSLFYGLLLIAYCVLSLFTVLLFQLKATSDLVMEANQSSAPRGVVVMRPKAVFGRGHRWHFRIMTVAVGVACAGVAVAVFLLTPRGEGSKMSPALLNPLDERQAGFSSTVQLSGEGVNTGSREAVFNMVVRVDGKTIADEGESFLLRGAALDGYDVLSRTWTRARGSMGDREVTVPADGVELAVAPPGSTITEADVTMRSGAQRYLFAMFPIISLKTPGTGAVMYNRRDQQITASENTQGSLRYTVRSATPPPGTRVETAPALMPERRVDLRAEMPPGSRGMGRMDESAYARGWSVELLPIRKLTLEVIRKQGLDRDVNALRDPNDAAIARVLENHLRDNFAYSLANRNIADGVDPIYDFLFTNRRGHCEVFASALAAMTRSIGMQARVVTGYRASEYNAIGGYYVIRQNNAHAWTEINTGDSGWVTFDCTPPDAVADEHRVSPGVLTTLRELYEHLEFTWINAIVSYDRAARNKVVSSVNHSLDETARTQKAWITDAVNWVKDFFSRRQFDQINITFMIITIFFILVGIASLIRSMIVRHRRLVALQLTALPRSRRRGLVRQLKFYLLMLDMLERHGFVRPSWQSPFSFAKELAANHPGRFDSVVALTELFYEIRFGYRELDKDRLRHIDAHLTELSQSLAKKSPSPRLAPA